MRVFHSKRCTSTKYSRVRSYLTAVPPTLSTRRAFVERLDSHTACALQGVTTDVRSQRRAQEQDSSGSLLGGSSSVLKRDLHGARRNFPVSRGLIVAVRSESTYERVE